LKPIEAVQFQTPSNLGIEMPINSTDEYRRTKDRARARLEHALTGNAEVLRRINENQAGWSLNLFQEAGEASGSFHSSFPREPIPQRGAGTDKARSQEEASRRARSQIRRYCAHNRLNRLGTLTFKGEGCHDPLQLRSHLSAFFVELRKAIGRDLPYLWVPEWHSTDHGLHVHFAVGRYIKRSVIESAWPHGFVHIKILGDLPHGSQDRDQARIAAGYLAKYVGKGLLDDRRIEGLHRYDIAQGFKPIAQRIFAPSRHEVIAEAIERMGSPYKYLWDSNDDEGWQKPPAVYLSW